MGIGCLDVLLNLVMALAFSIVKVHIYPRDNAGCGSMGLVTWFRLLHMSSNLRKHYELLPDNTLPMT